MATDFAVGCFGGLAGILVGHPPDTVKVRMQAQTSGNIRYHSTLHCIKEIISKESAFALYKGIMAPLYGQVALNAIIFGVHGNVFRKLQNTSRLKAEVIAGATAGFAQSIVVSPVELLKIRMQLQGKDEIFVKKQFKITDRYRYTNFLDCAKKIYLYENGLKGIFRGYTCTVLREVPAFGVYFGSYTYLCQLCGAINEDSLCTSKLLFCGGTAGMLSWFFTYPQDVIKTRLQSDGMGRTTYRGIFHCGRLIYKQEGLSVYTRGLSATMMRAFPANAATLTTVTHLKQFLDSGWLKADAQISF